MLTHTHTHTHTMKLPNRHFSALYLNPFLLHMTPGKAQYASPTSRLQDQIACLQMQPSSIYYVTLGKSPNLSESQDVLYITGIVTGPVHRAIRRLNELISIKC